MRLFLFCFALICYSPLQAQDVFKQFDIFFSTHVKGGLVDYQLVRSNLNEVNKLEKSIAKIDFKKESEDYQKAFLVNSYNFLTIAKLARNYPINSPKSIGGFFLKKDLELYGKKYSLDQIEKDLLFGLDRDPRFHLVLICGAKSCPPFPQMTFKPDQLDQQLETASIQAINSKDWIVEKDNSLYLAQIFNWYGYDFGPLYPFLKKYRPDLDANRNIKFEDYDWAINDSNSTGSGLTSFMTPSQLLNKGSWEVKLFQSVYTQKNRDGFDDFNTRSTFFSSFNQFNVGIGANINTGFDLVWKKNLVNDFSSNSFFEVFPNEIGDIQLMRNRDSLRNSSGDALRTSSSQGLSHFAPKIKFNPFTKIPKLTFQETVYIPINKAVDGQLISFTQFFYDQNLGSRSSVFLELSFWTPLTPEFKVNPFLKSFWSYFPNRHLSVYALLALPGEYGAGMKINITRRLELEFLHTRYIAVERFFGDRVAQTWNVGVRIHP